jgi:adenylate cyclase
VDDTPANIRLLEAVLVPAGYAVVGAGSGEEALGVLAGGAPDLVLLDVLMPGMDGLETCRRIRAEPAAIALPVVMITASEGQDKRSALEAGADDFIAKPFDTEELLARVASLLRIKEYHDTITAQARELAELNQDLEARVRGQVEELARLGRLRRFLPPPIAELILSASDNESILESHRVEVAVLVCALHGFTAFAEQSEPEEVSRILREFHEAIGGLVERFEATVGFFSGDGLLCFFNDPLPCSEPAWRALSLAVAMRARVGELATGWQRRGHELGLAAGVALGYATVGRMGFEGRWDYGPIGPVVKMASGLCEEAASGQILVAQRAYGAVAEHVEAAPEPELAIRGFPGPVNAFSVLGVRGAAPARDGLTARELEVLGLVAAGASNRQIAEQLFISEATAARHVANIFAKLSVHTRAEATRVAAEGGLLEGGARE